MCGPSEKFCNLGHTKNLAADTAAVLHNDDDDADCCVVVTVSC